MAGCLGFRVQLRTRGDRVQGLRFRVQGLGFSLGQGETVANGVHLYGLGRGFCLGPGEIVTNVVQLQDLGLGFRLGPGEFVTKGGTVTNGMQLKVQIQVQLRPGEFVTNGVQAPRDVMQEWMLAGTNFQKSVPSEYHVSRYKILKSQCLVYLLSKATMWAGTNF